MSVSNMPETRQNNATGSVQLPQSNSQSTTRLRRPGTDLEMGAVTSRASAHSVPAPNANGTAADDSAADEPEKDVFFQVIDVAVDGQSAEVQGSCYNSGQLEAFYGTVPAQKEDTIRVFLDGRGAVLGPNFEPYITGRQIGLEERKERDICPGFVTINRPVHESYPSPCPLYPASAFSLPQRHALLPTPKALWGGEPTFRRYGLRFFAFHDHHRCDPALLHWRNPDIKVKDEEVFILLHVVRDDTNLLKGKQHSSRHDLVC
jgi:hypothetical protein